MATTTEAFQSLRQARIARYSRVDLGRIRVRRACGPADLEVVASLRRAGFARVATSTEREPEWVDASDHRPGTFSLIASGADGQPVATMRVQDGRVSGLELQKLVPLDSLLAPDDQPVAQFGRLTAIKAADATEAMFGLFKSAWRWCLQQQLRTIVIATPPWSKPIYDFMFFEELGPEGEFTHDFAGGAHHVVMKLPVQSAAATWRAGKHPLSTEFMDTDHPSLAI